jgi:hypothetical protein
MQFRHFLINKWHLLTNFNIDSPRVNNRNIFNLIQYQIVINLIEFHQSFQRINLNQIIILIIDHIQHLSNLLLIFGILQQSLK